MGDDAAQVADAIAVGVGEAPRIDLVEHRLAPPRHLVGAIVTERPVDAIAHRDERIRDAAAGQSRRELVEGRQLHAPEHSRQPGWCGGERNELVDDVLAEWVAHEVTQRGSIAQDHAP